MFFLECEEYQRLHAPPPIFLSPNSISNIPQKWPILKEPTPCHRNHISSRVKNTNYISLMNVIYLVNAFNCRVEYSIPVKLTVCSIFH